MNNSNFSLSIDRIELTDSVRSILRKYVYIFYEEKEKPERLIIYGYLK